MNLKTECECAELTAGWYQKHFNAGLQYIGRDSEKNELWMGEPRQWDLATK